MNSTTAKKHKLTVFLIKEGYSSIDDFLKIDGCERIEVKEQSKANSSLIFKSGFRSKPSWTSIFEGLEGFNADIIWNQSSRALFAIRHEERWFCFTFGYARHLIDEHAYERNFGLIVTLNLADPLAIKAIDKTNIGHVSLHSKEQVTRAVELSGFGFNGDIDLLKSITGKSTTTEDGDCDTLSGRDSLTVHTRVSIGEFANIASELYVAFRKDTYKNLYPWIGNVFEERDKEIVEKLDFNLTEKIIVEELGCIWLAIPEVVVWEDITGFAYKKVRKKPGKPGPVIYPDLDIHEWLKVIKPPKDLSTKFLKSKKAYMYWQDGRPPASWSIYRCLNAELDLDDRKYVLNDGSWYSIEDSFVSEINNFYAAIPDSSIKLPPYHTHTEPEYLSEVSTNMSEFVLMDRKLIGIGGGRSKVEFCDLYSLDRDMVHVKKYGGSSLLSHLFSQAQVSGECFLHESDFRDHVNNYLPDTHKLDDPKARPDPSQYNVCIAIMSKVPGPLELPFFSRVSLRQAADALQKLGYNVSKLKIEI